VPVLRYDWKPNNAAAQGVALVKRNENTVKFRVPDGAGELKFLLTVTDGNGLTDDAEVTVTVNEALDPDLFLSYFGSADFNVVAVTDVASALASDVAFDLTIEQRISYFDLQGTRHGRYRSAAGPPAWTAAGCKPTARAGRTAPMRATRASRGACHRSTWTTCWSRSDRPIRNWRSIRRGSTRPSSR
jgi:hypothetical protein